MTTFVLLLVSVVANAETVQLTWVNPTLYVDGTALPVTDINQTRIEYGTCAGGPPYVFGMKVGEFIAAGGATHVISPSLGAGLWCFQAFTMAKGVESPPSLSTFVGISSPFPNPPTNLQATLSSVLRATETSPPRAADGPKSPDDLKSKPSKKKGSK